MFGLSPEGQRDSGSFGGFIKVNVMNWDEVFKKKEPPKEHRINIDKDKRSKFITEEILDYQDKRRKSTELP